MGGPGGGWVGGAGVQGVRGSGGPGGGWVGSGGDPGVSG